MPVHTRQLPTNSQTVLDGLVDPNVRHERPSPTGPKPSPNDEDRVGSPEEAPAPVSHFDSGPETGQGSELPWYRREKWLAVQVAAMVPILAAMVVPASYRLPLCVLGGALVAVGTVMLLRHKPMPASSGSGSA